MWQDNLINNLLVVGILTTLFTVVYCKITGKKFMDLIRELKETMADPIE